MEYSLCIADRSEMKLSLGTLSPGSVKFSTGRFSPVGLHVLVVDDDPLCLMVLERMLRQCNYKVTTCNRVSPALQLLRENKDDFDLVMSDVYMPDEDGFKLLEVIGLELDLPVIMMSANGETSVVMQGITHGACDYLIKPIRMEELRNIWQHVIRRKGKEVQRGSVQGEWDEAAQGVELQDQSSKKRKEFLEMEDCSVDGINSLKKARVNWSIQLHKQFVDAVNQLGVDKAVPKRILDMMNVQGLTRENVASHLQKYRLYLKRLSGVVPEPCPIASFQASGSGTTGGTMMVQPQGKASVANVGVKGRNLGAGIGSGPGREKKIDVGTMESLAKYKLHQQKQAANRAQVLNGLGFCDPRAPAEISSGGLQRMCSLDLSFLLQLQGIDSLTEQLVNPVDDLAACSFRTVKLEDDVAVTSGMCVSGVNNKRTYPSRQDGATQGQMRQWHQSSCNDNDEQRHKKGGIICGVPDFNGGESRALNMGYNKFLNNMDANDRYNIETGSSISSDKTVGSNEELMGGNTSGYNQANVAFDEVIGSSAPGRQSQYLQTLHEDQRHGAMYRGGVHRNEAYASSSTAHTSVAYPASGALHNSGSCTVDITDDSVSSLNVELSTVSTGTDISGDAFSESSFSALAQLGGILSPPPSPSTHLMHINELDISDYLQLDDGFGFQC